MSKQQSTEELLAERGKTHGDYADHASCTQRTLQAWMAEKNWDSLSYMQKESLHMFAHKVGRILTGNPDVLDHWDDIAGYSKLISQRIPGDAQSTPLPNPLKRLEQAAAKIQGETSNVRRVPRYEGLRAGTPEDGGHHAAASDSEITEVGLKVGDWVDWIDEVGLKVGDWVDWIDETTRPEWVGRLAMVKLIDGNVVTISFYASDLPQDLVVSAVCVRRTPEQNTIPAAEMAASEANLTKKRRPSTPSVIDSETDATHG